MIKKATISQCGAYRYFLSRKWDSSLPTAPFIMLNPSTADANEDDPTIRRICNYAKDWGFGGIVVVNLYALRVTDSKLLFHLTVDPIGPRNNRTLCQVVSTFPQVFCAWGNHAEPERVRTLVRMAHERGVYLFCLGENKDGSPKHPLYLKKDLQPVPWSGQHD